MLDSFVALPLAAKLSMAAVPGKGHVFQGRNGFVRGVDTLWRQVERVGISLVGFFVLYSWVRPDHFLVMVTCSQGCNSFVGGGDTLWRLHVERVRFQHGGFLVLCS